MRWIIAIFKWLGIVLVVAAASGAVYQFVGTQLDAKIAPPKSDMVSLDGHSYYVHCEGEGPNTFVMDAGLGAWSVFWWRFQAPLSAIGRACVLDRQGEGWSDAANVKHDGIAAADELDAIVKAAGIPTPFVYVGHSLGANFAQIYYGKYPHNVSALVLIEPGVPKDMMEDFKGTREQAMALADCPWSCTTALVAGYLGLGRLVSLTAPGKSFPAALKEQYRHGLARPTHFMNALAYLGVVAKTAYQTQDVLSFGDTPVLVLASENPLQDAPPEESLKAPGAMEAWRASQRAYFASLAAKSTHGAGPVIVANSTHRTIVLAEGPVNDVVAQITKLTSRVVAPAAPAPPGP
jgi:pimeloyl-ACP methyl ester carboxylesterase